MREVTVAMLALGGFGNSCLRHLFDEDAPEGFRLVAGIDPNPVGCHYLDRFEAEGIPIYPDLDAFYAPRTSDAPRTADLVIIAAPIHYHAPFTQTALAHGSNVLCEKPLAATVEEARAMAEAEDAAQGWVGIGYQWSFSATMQALKADIMAGELGHPLRLRTKVLWPRPLSYYHRNTWAGRIAAPDGRPILDSPVNNAAAHYLHNALYVLGLTRETSARPVDVQAELYRANAIENYDTAAVRVHTEDGAEILFYTAHPLDRNVGPEFVYEFEEATVSYASYGTPVRAQFRDGRVKDYGDPFADQFAKLWEAIDAVRTGAPLACGIRAATPHTICVDGAQRSPASIVQFPPEVVERVPQGEDDTLVYVPGLGELLETCYDRGVLPSELGGVSWARPGRRVALEESA